jgi:predicted DNA binding CopG/RHH family protein
MKHPRDKTVSEDSIHDWVGKVDLTKLEADFKPATFSGLKRTDWTKYYKDAQSTQPVSLRLPKFFLVKLKQKAAMLGIPYQTLIRLWIAERLGFR